MKTTWADDIRLMHEKFGVKEVVDTMDVSTLREFLAFRERFLREELDELERAEQPEDQVDALIDLCVVAIGTLDALGVDAQRAWNEVLGCNLSKRVGIKSSRPNPLGLPDLVKPESWTAPSHWGNVGRLDELPTRPDMSDRDYRYWSLANHVARWSKDPSTKVGAVLVGTDPREIALGYNGFPPGFDDSDERLSDREARLRLTQHAERNVLDNARFSVKGGVLYVTFFPCSECAKSITSKGIGKVLSPRPSAREPWASDAQWTEMILREAGVEWVGV